MKQLLTITLIIYGLRTSAQTLRVDSSILDEFKKQVGNSFIVGLGESGHGFESINETKSRLAEVLQRELQFAAILFESSFTESVVSFLADSTLDARSKNFLYPFWNTVSVKRALKPFFNQERGRGIPLILGFDIQEDCRFNRLSRFLLDKELVSKNKGRLLSCDSILSYYIGGHFSRKEPLSVREHQLLLHHYDLIAEEIRSRSLPGLQTKLLERSIDNRKWLCQYLSLDKAGKKMFYRDSLMAANIIWLQTQLYADKKLILWAADTHLAKKTSNRPAKWMGEWISSHYQNTFFAVSFKKGKGDKAFLREATSSRYSTKSREKFHLVIYLNTLNKIKAVEWNTPCQASGSPTGLDQ